MTTVKDKQKKNTNDSSFDSVVTNGEKLTLAPAIDTDIKVEDETNNDNKSGKKMTSSLSDKDRKMKEKAASERLQYAPAVADNATPTVNRQKMKEKAQSERLQTADSRMKDKMASERLHYAPSSSSSSSEKDRKMEEKAKSERLQYAPALSSSSEKDRKMEEKAKSERLQYAPALSSSSDKDRKMEEKAKSERLQYAPAIHTEDNSLSTEDSGKKYSREELAQKRKDLSEKRKELSARNAAAVATKPSSMVKKHPSNDNDMDKVKEKELTLRHAPAVAARASINTNNGTSNNNIDLNEKKKYQNGPAVVHGPAVVPGAVQYNNVSPGTQKEQQKGMPLLQHASGLAGVPEDTAMTQTIPAHSQGRPPSVVRGTVTQQDNPSNNANNDDEPEPAPGAFRVGGGRKSDLFQSFSTGGGEPNSQHMWTNVVAHLVADSDDSSDLEFGGRGDGNVVIAEELHKKKICGIPRKRFFGIVLFCINLAVGYTFFHLLYIRRRKSNKSSSTTDTTNMPPASPPTSILPPTFQIFNEPVLQTVKERGTLNCRATTSHVEKGHGITLDLCIAIAAAVFDDPIGAADRVEFVGIPFGEQFAGLWNNTIDVSSAATTHNMQREIFERATRLPMSFSTPFFYSGMVFAGIPEFVECADRLDTLLGICRKVSVCVRKDTTFAHRLKTLLPGITIHEKENVNFYGGFANGTCNVIATDILIWESDGNNIRELNNYTGEYDIGTKLHSIEPLALVTKRDDYQWTDFCNWILQALITAEAYNITKDVALNSSLWNSSVELLGDDKISETTSIFGDDYKNMFRNAIAAVGNYGEVYERNLESIIARSGSGRVTTINDGQSGLLHSEPFGSLEVSDPDTDDIRTPDPIPNGTLEAIVNRGVLRCGVIGNQTIFASLQQEDNNPKWTGIDVEYCRAIFASLLPNKLFSDNPDDSIEFINVGNTVQDGYVALANDEIDVLAGGSISLTADINEGTTGKGYTFTPPYYYYDTNIFSNNSNFTQDIDDMSMMFGRSLVTRETDSQWSSFVRWITVAIVYAEEQGITQLDALDMPVVELFGLNFIQMFRDAILGVGNYDEIFNRTMTEPYNIERMGRNLLNNDGGPQFVALPLV